MERLAHVDALQSKAQKGFAALVAFFGENPSSLPSDSSFWQPISSFGQSFSATQQTLLGQSKVRNFTKELITSAMQ